MRISFSFPREEDVILCVPANKSHQEIRNYLVSHSAIHEMSSVMLFCEGTSEHEIMAFAVDRNCNKSREIEGGGPCLN